MGWSQNGAEVVLVKQMLRLAATVLQQLTRAYRAPRLGQQETRVGLLRAAADQHDILHPSTALSMAHRRRQSELTQEAVTEAMSSLELGIPERIARASARADGAKTPTPM